MELLKADAAKDLEPPRYYIPIWVPVESPSEKIQRAKDELAAKVITEAIVEVSNDATGKETESTGKEETEITEAAVTLSPTKGNKSPKPQRERKKSKSKGGEEKSADEGEKIEKAEGAATPKTPPKADSTEDSKSPMKKSPEESSKSPKKSVGDEEQNIVQN